MKQRFSFTALVLWAFLIANVFALPLPAAEGRKLVLVAGSQSDAAVLSPEEVRKLYLGVAIAKDGKTFLPLCNHTDAVVYEAFMQKVMYMSGPAYERAIMTRLVRTTSSIRPPEYAAEKDLLQALAATPNAVTYMWADKAKGAGLKIVAELWHEQ